MVVGIVAAAGVVVGQTPESVDTVGSLPGIEIQTSVDLAEAFIGDPITYQVTIVHDSGIHLFPPPLGANLGAFDVRDFEPHDETQLKDGRVKSETRFVLSTFTTGDYIIPPLPMMFELPDKTRRIMLSEAVPIRIKSLLENAGDSVDIRPLKPPYEFPRVWTPYLVAAGIVLLLAAVALFVWRRMRRTVESGEPVDSRPPWEMAFEKLAFLRERKLPDQGKYKEFYIELTEIVRAFLGRVYGVPVLDMTTTEFMANFREIDLPADLLDKTLALLRQGDLVKFAKLVPGGEQCDDDFLLGHDIVELVRADQERRMQVQTVSAASSSTPATGGMA